MKTVLFAFLLIACYCLGAQINLADSSVQVISYWNKGEVQNYRVVMQDFKLKGSDTTSRNRTIYDVEMTVIDSTAKSYTIRWLYKNMSATGTNTLMQKIIGTTGELAVIYKTDELGVFKSVENWKEVRDYVRNGLEPLRTQYNAVPEKKKILDQVEKVYTSREAIETTAIRDIQQFHKFHGAKYKMNEVLEGQLKVTNIYGPEPFDADFKLYVDEINVDDNDFVIRFNQVINKEQLIDATHGYLKKMAATMKVPAPSRDDLKSLGNDTEVGSRVHGSGWLIYSFSTVTVTAENETSVNECIIEIK